MIAVWPHILPARSIVTWGSQPGVPGARQGHTSFPLIFIFSSISYYFLISFIPSSISVCPLLLSTFLTFFFFFFSSSWIEAPFNLLGPVSRKSGSSRIGQCDSRPGCRPLPAGTSSTGTQQETYKLWLVNLKQFHTCVVCETLDSIVSGVRSWTSISVDCLTTLCQLLT